MYKNTRIGTATILSIKIQCREIFLSKYISCKITMTVTRKGEMNTITVLFCTIYIQIDQNFRYSFDTTTWTMQLSWNFRTVPIKIEKLCAQETVDI